MSKNIKKFEPGFKKAPFLKKYPALKSNVRLTLLKGSNFTDMDQELPIELIEIKKLKQHPRNPNIGDAGLISELIKRNAWFGVVTVNRRTSHILDGNHRVQAAEIVGMEKLPVYWVDKTDEEELDILLSANEAARQAYADRQLLADILRERDAAGEILNTGFDQDRLDEIINDLANPFYHPENHPNIDTNSVTAGDVDRAQQGMSNIQVNQGSKDITCPHCGSSFEVTT